jgi:serine phosphatase RsbU (regulator of sigma subunit)
VVTFAYTRSGEGRDDLEVDLELAVELARRAATAIDNARLYRDRSHIARTLQRSLLPPRLPHIDGFEIAARYRAAGEGNEVGGDFYDVFQRTADSWIFVLGDVCGKGPEAAALTALARHTIRAAAIRDGAPRVLLRSLHEAMARDHERELAGERFMTAVAACLSLSDDVPRIHLGGAGHPPPLLLHADGRAELVEPTGRALGLDCDPDIAQRELDMLPGDTLVLYTDGVTDAGAPAHQLDIEELAALAAGEAGTSAERIVELLEQAALDRSAGHPRDDIALVALRRAG